MGDFAAAAMYFGRMASLFAQDRWNSVEATMLRMYAQCLKKLNRKDEYVRTLLELLAISAAKRKEHRGYRQHSVLSKEHPGWLDDDTIDTSGVLAELLDFSEQLPYDVTVPMAKYFGDIAVEPYVRHYEDQDGFQLRLLFRHVLEDAIDIREAKVRLTSATPVGREIWLDSSETLRVSPGTGRLWVKSNVRWTM